MLELLGDIMEDPKSMRFNAEDKLKRAREFAKEPGRKAMALGFAQASKLLYLQLGDKQGENLARDLVEEIEREAAQEKAQLYAEERRKVEDAAVRWGTATQSDAATENLTRLQTGLWIAFEQKADLAVWKGECEASSPKPFNPKIENPEVSRLLDRIREMSDVQSVEGVEIQRVFKQPFSWLVKVRIVSSWGKRTFLLSV